MSEEIYQPVCALTDLRINEPRYISVSNRHVILVRLAAHTRNEAQPAQVVATAAMCPHQMADLTYGPVHAGIITCPMHQYRFNLQSGACLETHFSELKLPTYPVRIEAGQVWVAVAPPAWMA